MTNYKEIIRLYSSGDYSNREISTILKVSRNTISRCVERAQRYGIPMPVPEAMTNEELADKLFPKEGEITESQYKMPDFSYFSEELKKPHVTKKLLWKEYVNSCVNSGLKTYSILEVF